MTHSFEVDVAVECGVNSAVLLNNIAFWIAKNAACDKHYHNGEYWTYNSAKAFAILFPYITNRQIETAIKGLVDSDYLIKGNYNTSLYDRTLWYALTEKSKAIYKIKLPHLHSNVNGLTDECTPIPDINTDINTDDKPEVKDTKVKDILPVGKSSAKTKYGLYANVKLTDEDVAKLTEEFPFDWQERIERLSEYIATKGDKYKNHLAVIRSWAKKDGPKGITVPMKYVTIPEENLE